MQRPLIIIHWANRSFRNCLDKLKKNTNSNEGQGNRLLNREAINTPGERRGLRAEPLHQYLCVGGDTGRTHWSTSNNHQTFDSIEGRTTDRRNTGRAAGNHSGCRKSHSDPGAKGRDKTRKPRICYHKIHYKKIVERDSNCKKEDKNTTMTTRKR